MANLEVGKVYTYKLVKVNSSITYKVLNISGSRFDYRALKVKNLALAEGSISSASIESFLARDSELDKKYEQENKLKNNLKEWLK